MMAHIITVPGAVAHGEAGPGVVIPVMVVTPVMATVAIRDMATVVIQVATEAILGMATAGILAVMVAIRGMVIPQLP